VQRRARATQIEDDSRITRGEFERGVARDGGDTEKIREFGGDDQRKRVVVPGIAIKNDPRTL